MSVHEHIPPRGKKGTEGVGWTKGLELAKVARSEGQEFDCATWLHKARSLPKEEFKREVEKELTGRETEAWEIIYFKVYKSQIPVIEQAIETAALMLGTGKSRGYCLEMICADFLAGANLNGEDSSVLLQFNRATLQIPARWRARAISVAGGTEIIVRTCRHQLRSPVLSPSGDRRGKKAGRVTRLGEGVRRSLLAVSPCRNRRQRRPS